MPFPYLSLCTWLLAVEAHAQASHELACAQQWRWARIQQSAPSASAAVAADAATTPAAAEAEASGYATYVTAGDVEQRTAAMVSGLLDDVVAALEQAGNAMAMADEASQAGTVEEAPGTPPEFLLAEA